MKPAQRTALTEKRSMKFWYPFRKNKDSEWEVEGTNSPLEWVEGLRDWAGEVMDLDSRSWWEKEHERNHRYPSLKRSLYDTLKSAEGNGYIWPSLPKRVRQELFLFAIEQVCHAYAEASRKEEASSCPILP